MYPRLRPVAPPLRHDRALEHHTPRAEQPLKPRTPRIAIHIQHVLVSRRRLVGHPRNKGVLFGDEGAGLCVALDRLARRADIEILRRCERVGRLGKIGRPIGRRGKNRRRTGLVQIQQTEPLTPPPVHFRIVVRSGQTSAPQQTTLGLLAPRRRGLIDGVRIGDAEDIALERVAGVREHGEMAGRFGRAVRSGSGSVDGDEGEVIADGVGEGVGGDE